jgi:hypothetical protein
MRVVLTFDNNSFKDIESALAIITYYRRREMFVGRESTLPPYQREKLADEGSETSQVANTIVQDLWDEVKHRKIEMIKRFRSRAPDGYEGLMFSKCAIELAIDRQKASVGASIEWETFSC